MEKKPLNIVVKDARQAARELNEFVEKGAFNFDFGINKEYVITVSKGSDGVKKEEKEPRFRLIGFMDMYQGKELDSLNAVKDDLKKVQKEREEMNRTLKIMNKSAFAPISVFLLIVALIVLTFGILTIAGILPIPPEQRGIAILLIVIGVFALAGSIVLAVFRGKKKKALLERKDDVLAKDANLQAREAEIDARVPDWYKKAIWTVEGNVIRNMTQRHEIK